MPDPIDIYHWQRLDDRITTSGQPTEAELAEISRLGVRKIINLALATSPGALPDEAAFVTALGMDYIHIPVDFAAPTEADFASFCAAMSAAPAENIHVHCAANYRVSAFMCRYRRDVLGLDPVQARADLEQIWRPDEIWAAFIAPAG